MEGKAPRLQDAYTARKRIESFIRRTPLVESDSLSRWVKGDVYIKLECMQTTGSFKLRGATNKILSLGPGERERGVITVSSGNHGRAVAYVARHAGINAVICMSSTVPRNKVAAIEALGAELVIAGDTYDEASVHAAQLQKARRLTFVHPFDDPDIIAGQATIGLEIIEDLPDVDTVIVPLSGGGLMSGIALALKTIKPEIHMVGVSMELGPAMYESVKAGKIVDVVEEPSLADALIGGLGSENCYTLDLISDYVDEIVLVSEEQIAAGMMFAIEKQHLVVEGGGAVGFAALLAGKVPGEDQRLVVVASGSNVDLDVLFNLPRS